VYRSKAVGEPPLMLAIAVWAAAKNALASVSTAAAADLQLPATGEEILRCLCLMPSPEYTAAAISTDGHAGSSRLGQPAR
jgi:xanthine dehydrogenase large subunit